MKIGSPDWLRRERDWLEEDLRWQLKFIADHPKIPTEMIEDAKIKLAGKRKALKLLRDNPREYVRQTKEELS